MKKARFTQNQIIEFEQRIERDEPHKLVIVSIARRLVAIANAVLKAGLPWRMNCTS